MMAAPKRSNSAANRGRASVLLSSHSKSGSLWHRAPVVEADGTLVAFRYDTPRVGVTCVAWDPLDEARLAFGDSRGNVYVAYIRTNRYLLSSACGHGIADLVFSSVRRGDLVVALANRTIEVLNVDKGSKPVQTLRGTHHSAISTVTTGAGIRNGVVASASADCVAVWAAPFTAAHPATPLPSYATTSTLMTKHASSRYDLRHSIKTSRSNPALQVTVTWSHVVTCHADSIVFWEISGPLASFKIPLVSVIKPPCSSNPPAAAVGPMEISFPEAGGVEGTLSPLEDLPTYDCMAISQRGACQVVVAGSSRGSTLAVFRVKEVSAGSGAAVGGLPTGAGGSSVQHSVTLVKTVDLSSAMQTPFEGFRQLAFYRRGFGSTAAGSPQDAEEEILAALSTSGAVHLVGDVFTFSDGASPGDTTASASTSHPPKLLGTHNLAKGSGIERFSILRGIHLAAVVGDAASAAHLRVMHVPSAELYASFSSGAASLGSATAGGAAAAAAGPGGATASLGARQDFPRFASFETTMFTPDAQRSTSEAHHDTKQHEVTRPFVTPRSAGVAVSAGQAREQQRGGTPPRGGGRVVHPVPLGSAVSNASGWIKSELKPSALRAKHRAASAGGGGAHRRADVVGVAHAQALPQGRAAPRRTTPGAAGGVTAAPPAGATSEMREMSLLYRDPAEGAFGGRGGGGVLSAVPQKRMSMRQSVVGAQQLALQQHQQGVARRRQQRAGGGASISAACPLPASPPPGFAVYDDGFEVSEGQAGQGGLDLTLNLSDTAVSLNVVKLRRMLFTFGQYPDPHRSLIWRFLLRLPNSEASNQAFSALLYKGPHPATRMILKEFPVKDSKLRVSLEKLVDCLSYHSKALSVVPWLPEMVFPFAKVFGSNIKAAFECCLMFLTNWGKHLLLSYPHYSFETVSMVQWLIRTLDPELAEILQEKNCEVELYAWNPIVSVFTDILSAPEWCQVMDHAFSNQPIWLYLFLVAYLSHHKGLFRSAVVDPGEEIRYPVGSAAEGRGAASPRNVRRSSSLPRSAHRSVGGPQATPRLQKQQRLPSEQFFTAFFRRNNPVDINAVIQRAYSMHRQLVSRWGDHQQQQRQPPAGAAAASLSPSGACESLFFMECFPAGASAADADTAVPTVRQKRGQPSSAKRPVSGATPPGASAGVYPMVLHLVDAEVDRAVQERDKIVAQEAYLMKVRQNSEEIARQVEVAEAEHERRVQEMVHRGEAAHLALEREAALHADLAQVKGLVLEEQAEGRLRRVNLQQRVASLEMDLAAAGGSQSLGRLHESLMRYQAVAGVAAAESHREALLLSVEEAAQKQFEQSVRCMAGGLSSSVERVAGGGGGAGGIPLALPAVDGLATRPVSPPSPLAEAAVEPAGLDEVVEAEGGGRGVDARLQKNDGILAALRVRDASVGTSPQLERGGGGPPDAGVPPAAPDAAQDQQQQQQSLNRSIQTPAGSPGVEPHQQQQQQQQHPQQQKRQGGDPPQAHPEAQPAGGSLTAGRAAGAAVSGSPAAAPDLPAGGSVGGSAEKAAGNALPQDFPARPALDALNRMVDRELLSNYQHTRARIQAMQRAAAPPSSSASSPPVAAAAAGGRSASASASGSSGSTPSAAANVATSHEVLDQQLRDRGALLKTELARARDEMVENKETLKGLTSMVRRRASYPDTTTSSDEDLLRHVQSKDEALRTQLLRTETEINENIKIMRKLERQGSELVRMSLVDAAKFTASGSSTPPHVSGAADISFAVSSLSAGSTQRRSARKDSTAEAAQRAEEYLLEYQRMQSAASVVGGASQRQRRSGSSEEEVSVRLDMDLAAEELKEVSPRRPLQPQHGGTQEQQQQQHHSDPAEVRPFHNPFLNERSLDTVTFESPDRDVGWSPGGDDAPAAAGGSGRGRRRSGSGSGSGGLGEGVSRAARGGVGVRGYASPSSGTTQSHTTVPVGSSDAASLVDSSTLTGSS